MTARDELLAALWAGDIGDDKEWAERLVDAYAHELAEHLRTKAGDPPSYSAQASRSTYRWHARRNADLIDPEKK